jgi:hypothetical protein
VLFIGDCRVLEKAAPLLKVLLNPSYWDESVLFGSAPIFVKA